MKPNEGRGTHHETDKNLTISEPANSTKKSNTKTDACEGDPDFVNDAARLYMTIESNPDEQFNITPKNIPTGFKTIPEPKKNVAASVVKADEVRIIARKTGLDSQKDSEMSGPNADKNKTNGSIRLIKEGKLDEDAASIYLLPDGTIQISGNVIFLGRADGVDKGSDSLTAGEGPGKSEPYLRYSDFEIWADGLIDAVNTAFANAQSAINANGTAMNSAGSGGSSGGSSPGYGGPNSPLGSAFGNLIGPDGMSYKHASDKSAIDKFKSKQEKMKAIRSKRIFGE